ncbi:MAG: hypothetical protein M3R72_11740 [Bacteroidota bacterium]|nr:hypothetical protein [Bacteroidota bacterium]
MKISVRNICLVVILLLILCVLFVYAIIPSSFTIQADGGIRCNTAAASRTINYRWKDIFYRHSDTAFYLDKYAYQIKEPLYNGSRILIKKNGITYNTIFLLIPLSADSLMVHWKVDVVTGNNPLKRVFTYFTAQDLKKNMNEFVEQLQTYLSKTSNVYCYDINRTTLTDTVLVFTKQLSHLSPNVEEVYSLVVKLRNYIKEKKAKETNSPMLNVTNTDSGYLTMVGIPTNKGLPPTKEIVSKYLIPMKDKMLVTEVKGGGGTIKDAYQQVEQYMIDHSLSAPVIPFELMITDRNRQKDTAKWVTKIFYPII